MMAEAIGWNDTVPSTDDTWHVAVAPDDVKVVSLEQLDDLFRLSLVDSETKVWQVGMTEWLPLGVVAGLDEKPAPPKRAHPKPPSPRSAPPPPPRRSSPAASFYPEPPRAPAAISYAAPLSYTAPVSYAAPLAPMPSFAPPPSVRPLVVSHNPYLAPRRGGTFGRFVVGLALLAGVGITLYRNDVLRDAARSLHQEATYARLEQALGGPSFGTLRALDQTARNAASAALTLTSVSGTDATSSQTAAAEPSKSTATPSTPGATQAASAGHQPPVVSLESLGTEKAGATSAKVELKSAPAPAPLPAIKAAPSASPVSAVSSKSSVVKSVAKRAAAEPEAKPAKAAPAEKPAPAPVAQKPESEMTPRERLNAEIARAMQNSPASAKKSAKSSTGLKGTSSEYDPLNPKL